MQSTVGSLLCAKEIKKDDITGFLYFNLKKMFKFISKSVHCTKVSGRSTVSYYNRQLKSSSCHRTGLKIYNQTESQ